MDRTRARQALNQNLKRLAQQRARRLEEAEDVSLKIGATTAYLREHLGQSKAASAGIAGVSASHMTELMAKAAATGVVIEDPMHRLPRLQSHEVGDFLSEHGGMSRLISSFDDGDLLYMSGVDPTQLLQGEHLWAAHMMVQAGDEQWAVVDDVQVGYGGTGPNNALRLLDGLGLEHELSRAIAYHRVSDVRFDGSLAPAGEPLHSVVWPHVPLAAPILRHDHWVVPVDTDGITWGERPDPERPEPRTPGGSFSTGDHVAHLFRWLDFLSNPEAPAWVRGPRRARAYLDPYAAEAAGLTADALGAQGEWDGSRFDVFPVVIEQGTLQLWLHTPESTDPTQRFAPEVYTVLRAAGFYVDDLAASDNRHAFWRWVTSLGSTRPAYVDLDDMPLRYPTG